MHPVLGCKREFAASVANAARPCASRMAITFVALTLNNTERSGFVRASRAVLPELEVFIAVNGYSK